MINIALAAVGALLLLTGLLSEAIRRGPAQEPLIAVGFGVLIGPAVLGWIDLDRWGDPHLILEEAARLTLAVGLMAVALRLGPAELRRFWKPVALLLTTTMPGMFAIGSGLGVWLLGLPLLTALVVGAALTPTDPVVASSIVTGKFAERKLPRRVRASLSLESGANDGLAYPFLMLPLLLLVEQSSAAALGRWAWEGLALGVLIAAAAGVAIGWAAARALRWAECRSLIGDYSFSVHTVALSFFTLGAARLIGADELIAVFAAGLTYNVASVRDGERREAHVQESVNRLFTLPIFVLFGMALPWGPWREIGMPLAGFAIAVLLLRRLPLFVPLQPLLRSRYGWRDLAYMGWFGPNGVAAIFYCLFAVRHIGEETVWTVGSFVILASIFAHGVTAAAFTRAYASASRASRRRRRSIDRERSGDPDERAQTGGVR